MTDLPANYNERVIDPATRMDHALFSFSAVKDRPPLVWPGGARVAIAVSISVDTADLVTDPMGVLMFSYRDYGPRVGLFRLMGILDEFAIKATMPVSEPLRAPKSPPGGLGVSAVTPAAAVLRPRAANFFASISMLSWLKPVPTLPA